MCKYYVWFMLSTLAVVCKQWTVVCCELSDCPTSTACLDAGQHTFSDVQTPKENINWGWVAGCCFCFCSGRLNWSSKMKRKNWGGRAQWWRWGSGVAGRRDSSIGNSETNRVRNRTQNRNRIDEPNWKMKPTDKEICMYINIIWWFLPNEKENEREINKSRTFDNRCGCDFDLYGTE